jgi:hypothetical protein
MELRAEIDPGVCGYPTAVTARSEDGRHVEFTFECDCDLIEALAEKVAAIQPVDAIASLSPDENPVLAEARTVLQGAGCCEACIVPQGAVKAMYIITGLALARNVSMKLRDG